MLQELNKAVFMVNGKAITLRGEGAEEVWDELQCLRAQPAAGEGWRDIASAPKDGEFVLLYLPTFVSHSKVQKCVWVEEHNRWESLECDFPHLLKPTHWMPLPAAPGTPPANAGGGNIVRFPTGYNLPKNVECFCRQCGTIGVTMEGNEPNFLCINCVERPSTEGGK